MPRHNQSGPTGRRSSSAGRSTSGKENRREKSFGKADKGNRKGASASGRPFEKNKGKDYGSSRNTGKPATRRSYDKKTGADTYRSAPKNFRSDDSDSEKKSYGQRSRFAKPQGGPAREKPGNFSSAPKRASSRPPGRTASTGFSKSERTEGRKDRNASFGKPFKKSYPATSGRPRTAGIHRRTREADANAPKSDKVRLNKFIANSGISSRREADELIKMGLISVNGKVVSELGHKVSPSDEVRYEDKVLRAEKPVYILMNKPKGFLTTTDDPQDRKTVMHIIGSMVKQRIYPVGRLDRNTTGLLLLTNDGDLADRLMHPSFTVKKVYKVELDRPLTKGDFQSIVDGIRLEEGKAMVDDLAIVSSDGRTVGVELHIGWNRVVRRIFESLGYEVVKLDRTTYAGLDKKELTRGQWRFLTKEEIIHLKHFK